MSRQVVVTRMVAADDPGNYLHRMVYEGETFWTFHLNTYGCVDTWNGIALSEVKDEYPFFEFPLNAIKYVDA